MKLYDANAGNTKRVRIFIAEKGIDIPREVLELGKDTRTPEYRKINSLGEVPALELDDGRIITESNAICRYLEMAFPENPLMGVDAAEQGHIEMWSQRIYYQLFLTIGLMVRHEIPLFEDVVDQVPAFAEAQRKGMPEKWRWLNREMADGRSFIAGDSFTFADVQGMAVLNLADIFDLNPPDDCSHVRVWAAAMRERPSWEA